MPFTYLEAASLHSVGQLLDEGTRDCCMAQLSRRLHAGSHASGADVHIAAGTNIVGGKSLPIESMHGGMLCYDRFPEDMHQGSSQTWPAETVGQESGSLMRLRGVMQGFHLVRSWGFC